MSITPVKRGDLSALLTLMEEFAAFDGSHHKLSITQDQLGEALFGDKPSLHSLIARIGDIPVGFLNYQFTFSSFELRHCLWVEDVFVREDHRGMKIGWALFERARAIAAEKNCLKLEWLVRRHNHIGRAFYGRLGASMDETTIYVDWKIDAP